MFHIFDVDIATEYGLVDAILINHIGYWVLYNEANNTNFHDDYYWTYNSIKALVKLFPYLSEKKIRGALDRLVEKGLVLVGEYNSLGYDRTKWYTLSQKGKCTYTKGQMDVAKRANGVSQKGKPIPYINNINNNIYIEEKEIYKEKEEIEELQKNFDLIYREYPLKKGKAKGYEIYRQWLKGRKVDGMNIKLTNKQMWLAVVKYQKECEAEEREEQYIKHFDTFMRKAILDYLEEE